MMKVISECPACGKRLKITALHCSDCGLELRNDFQFSSSIFLFYRSKSSHSTRYV